MQYGPVDTSSTQSLNGTEPQAHIAQSQDPDAQTDTAILQNEPVALERLIERFNSPNTLLLFGVLLMVVVMMRLLRKSYKSNKQRTQSQGSPAERIAEIHSKAQTGMDPSQRVMIEAEEMARRLGAALDNKAARLELLIEEADRKLNELNRSNYGQPQTRPQESHAESTQEIGVPPAAESTPSRSLDPTLLDRARLEQDFEERQTRVAGRIEPPETAPAPAPKAPDIQTQITELAAAGLTSNEIAAQLKEPVGQVELILNLRKQQG